MANTIIGDRGTVVQPLLEKMNGASSANNGLPVTDASGNDLQRTFLKLLVTQLQNQDPTHPMDNSQMTSQLAQINTVTGIHQLNTTLASLATQFSAAQSAQASLLLDKRVLVPGNTVSVTKGESTEFGVTLASNVSHLKIEIKNVAGQIVNTLDLGARSAGAAPVKWKPVDSSGDTLPDGAYTVSATSAMGSASRPETTLIASSVKSIMPKAGGEPTLMLHNGKSIGLSDIAAIF